MPDMSIHLSGAPHEDLPGMPALATNPTLATKQSLADSRAAGSSHSADPGAAFGSLSRQTLPRAAGEPQSMSLA